ncbi:MAG: recombination regulator RecX [Lachnospiraceae bacterium]|nr:recombination regulator RecX [Lachnospiraceae bacterium]
MECVAEIKKLTGGRSLVALESGLSFPLYGTELAEYGITEGAMISTEVIARIMKEVLPRRAQLFAMHLLEKMDRTEFQLREKLRQSGYPDEIIDDAVGYVKGYHYIDDLRYAGHYLESHGTAKSLRRMEQDLYEKGIAKEVVAQAVSEAELPDEESQIRELLEKKHYDPAQSDRKTQQKLYAFLQRRGYGISAISHVMNLSDWQ